MKINIYYGGRGLIEDATIFVINKMTEVLEELRVDVKRYNLYEQKNGISMLPNTLKEADAAILAVNIEWLGIGGYMQQFLDACWLFADKEKIKNIVMFPVAIANTYGERDAESILIKAWELLGGIACNGIAAYVQNHIEFETDTDYSAVIEKQTEILYRFVNQKTKVMPSSNYVVKQNILKNAPIELTPQESEQLSVYVSDDTYVKKQKEDIEELTQLFKGMLDITEKGEAAPEFVKELFEHYKPQGKDFVASYAIHLTDSDKTLVIEIAQNSLNCHYGEKENADVNAKTTKEVMNKLINGRITLQGAFMSGELTAKGNFKTLRTFDQVFCFNTITPAYTAGGSTILPK